MNHKRPPVPAIIVVVLLVIVSAYFIVTQAVGDKDGALTASGTIEATVVNVSPEVAGKVKEVLVEEGQPVKPGDPILILDESLLAAQRTVAESNVAFGTQCPANRSKRPGSGTGTVRCNCDHRPRPARCPAPRRLGQAHPRLVRTAELVLQPRRADQSPPRRASTLPNKGWNKPRRTSTRSSRISTTPISWLPRRGLPMPGRTTPFPNRSMIMPR